MVMSDVVRRLDNNIRRGAIHQPLRHVETYVSASTGARQRLSSGRAVNNVVTMGDAGIKNDAASACIPSMTTRKMSG